MKSKSIKQYYQQGGTVEPDATKVHNNIDSLILQAKLDEFDKTGIMRTQPEDPRSVADALTRDWIEGIVPMPAVGGFINLIARKSPDIAKIVKETGLRNPISHYTSGSNAASILNRKKIVGTGEFPGRRVPGQSASAVSVTRDPMFTSRPHGSIGTDIRFILDRDELVKKGFPMEPIAVRGYRKTNPYEFNKENARYQKMNPKFEFEERVRGSIPTENIKLIDILQLPLSESDQSHNMLRLLRHLYKTNIPIIKSSSVAERLRKMPMSSSDSDYWKGNYLRPKGTLKAIQKLMEAPTYDFDPFKKVR